MPSVTGRDGPSKRLAELDATAVQRVGAALFAGGEIIRAEASHMITEGAVSGKYHVPSVPGDPPNEDTGDLRNHMQTIQVAPLHVELIDDSDHAVPLEFGTSKMLPRPYMAPATERKRQDVVDLVRQAVNAATKG